MYVPGLKLTSGRYKLCQMIVAAYSLFVTTVYCYSGMRYPYSHRYGGFGLTLEISVYFLFLLGIGGFLLVTSF